MDGVLELGRVGYPERLAGVSDAPDALYLRGTWSERALAVSIVGARAASARGRELAVEFAASVAAAGGAVISGGALGIDAAAHRGALDSGGLTVAVMAGGLDQLYPPRNLDLLAAIAERGALLSPYAAAEPPRRYQFVRRNRVIAGLADLVVVVEAGRSSGSLHTARAALDYGRHLAAVPGSPGCEALVAQGAAPVASGAEVIAAASGQRRASERALPAAGTDEARVLSALGDAPRATCDLASATGLDEVRVVRALAGLELSRLVLAMPGAAYVRV